MPGESERKEQRPAARDRKPKPVHEEQVRLLFERAEREALRSICRDMGSGSPESATDTLYALELLRKVQKGDPLPPRPPRPPPEE